MPTKPPETNSPKPSLEHLDLNLPVSDVPWPMRSAITPEEAYALNAEMWKTQVLDETYWAESLARKNPEPFVM